MPSPGAPEYPWYHIIRGNELEQGDILLGCPHYFIPPEAMKQAGPVEVRVEETDAIILTQSCDLAIRPNGSCEATDVMLCPVVFKKELAEHSVFKKDEAWEDTRKGRRPYFHVLNECNLPGFELDFMLIDFHSLFSLSVDSVRQFAVEKGDRVRLLPPYREHLSQAFARLFMRVGLPQDIPPFGKKK